MRPDDPAIEAWRAFLVAHARVTRRLEQELQAEQGMSLADYDVLVQLAFSEKGRLRMSDLADRLLLSRSGATRLIDRLQRRGLVDRTSCEDDRRGQWAVLTDAGRQRLREASPTHLRGVGDHFVQHIPPDELRQLRAILSRFAG
jgi:DNA-binding MarR family transcriptional regulator